MNTPKHTPGPWRITGERSPCSIEAGPAIGSAALAKVYLTDPKTRRRTPEFEANARLIAAAPALVEALQDVEACCPISPLSHDRLYVVTLGGDAINRLRAALKSAGVDQNPL